MRRAGRSGRGFRNGNLRVLQTAWLRNRRAMGASFRNVRNSELAGLRPPDYRTGIESKPGGKRRAIERKLFSGEVKARPERITEAEFCGSITVTPWRWTNWRMVSVKVCVPWKNWKMIGDLLWDH